MYDYEEEIIIGKLKQVPTMKFTTTNKAICSNFLETSEEEIRLIAWEDLALELNEIKKDMVIKISGYRKYNTYIQKEEFVIKGILNASNTKD